MDCRLLELALKERWEIPPDVVRATVAGLSSVIEEPENLRKKPRLWLKCVQALTALSRKNLAAVETGMRARAQEELEERLRGLEERLQQQGEHHEP